MPVMHSFLTHFRSALLYEQTVCPVVSLSGTPLATRGPYVLEGTRVGVISGHSGLSSVFIANKEEQDIPIEVNSNHPCLRSGVKSRGIVILRSLT